MSKKRIIDICALCKKENVELMESHIISKLAYKRTKLHKNSRFRNFKNINDIFQDGEKKPLLCHDCEEFFSQYETEFANKFLDVYLSNTKVMPKLYDNIDDFIVSITWRILFDDLYNFNSFPKTDNINQPFYYLENTLSKYLNNKRINKEAILPTNIKNYIYSINEFGLENNVIEAFKPAIWGYSIRNSNNTKYMIYAYFNQLIVATVYSTEKSLLSIKNIVRIELEYQFGEMIKQYPKNKEILDKGLRKKLERRYR